MYDKLKKIEDELEGNRVFSTWGTATRSRAENR